MHFIADTSRRTFTVGGHTYPMAIGKSGAIERAAKREGDAKTPLGRYSLEYGYYRADRLETPRAGVDLRAICESDGWCDGPEAAGYNQPLSLPSPYSHERLTRGDALYDLVFVLSHNRWPVVPGYGSAIFLHVAKENGAVLAPTQGCLALRKADLLEIAPHLTRQSWLIIR